jgi:hypothetical protein
MAVECDEPARQARFLKSTKSRENCELHQKALMYRPPSARQVRPQSARPRADSVPTASNTPAEPLAQVRIYVPRPPPAAPLGPPPDNTRRARPASANVAPRGSSSGDVASLRQVYVPQVAVAIAAAAAAAAAAAQQQSGTQSARRDEDNKANFVSKVAYPVYRRTVISVASAASVSSAHSQQELQHEQQQQQQQPKQRSAVRPRSAATHRSSDAAAMTAAGHNSSSNSAASPDRRRERSGRVGVTSRPQSAGPRRAHNIDDAAAAARKLSGSTSAAYSFTGTSSAETAVAAVNSVNSKQYAQQQQQQQQHRPPPYQPHAYKQRRESVESMMARIFQQKLNTLQMSTASSASTAVATAATATATAVSVPSKAIKASPHWAVSSAAAPAATTAKSTSTTAVANTSVKRSDSVGSAASAQTVVRSAVAPNTSQHGSHTQQHQQQQQQQQQHKRVRPASACESGRGGSVGAGGGFYARLFRKGQIGYRGSKCIAYIYIHIICILCMV